MTRGFSFGRVLWAGGTAALCLWTKNTVFIALPLFALALIFIWFRGKSRRWLWLTLAALLSLGLGISLTFNEAAYWYRATSQDAPARIVNEQAPLGSYALQVKTLAETTPHWLEPLAQPLPLDTARALGGTTITAGTWAWASEPVETRLLSIHDGTNTIRLTGTLTDNPSFFATTARLPEGTSRVWLTIEPTVPAERKNVTVFYDGMLLVKGEYPVDEIPSFTDGRGLHGLWEGEPFENLLRNPSAERAWPSLRPWVDNQIARFAPDQTRPSMVLYSVLDPSAAGWYYQISSQSLFRTFWAKFGWGHVSLIGNKPYRSIEFFTFFCLFGTLFAMWRKKLVLKGDTLAWLILLTLGVWSSTLTRGAIYIFVNRVFIPVARYAAPAIIPTTLLLSVGWTELLTLAERGLRLSARVKYIIYVSFFLVIDVVSIISIIIFYNGR
jgi:hypothetical protein